ncbi:hypothetical protein MMC17_005124 [Xylographa soralifera]|nr:hypothetical protein [Xylographa soralifera]
MTTPDSLPTNRLGVAATIPRSKSWPWYHEFIEDKLTSSVKDLLEGYSGIRAEDAESHVYKIVSKPSNVPSFLDYVTKCVVGPYSSICVPTTQLRAARDMAWEIFPWPCIGEFWFISLGLSSHPSYPQLLTHLKSDPTTTLLDLGTCLGQDLRKLVYDGIPASQLQGSDLFAEYEAAGHALWRDEKKFRNRFIAADVFATQGPLADMQGTWDVISIFMFLHVWDLSDQKRACKRILNLLKPRPGSWIIGAQSGSINPRHFPLRPPFVAPGEERSVYRHSVETFREMWEEVGKEEGLALDVWVEYQRDEVSGNEIGEREGGKLLFSGDDNRRIYFLIKRL